MAAQDERPRMTVREAGGGLTFAAIPLGFLGAESPSHANAGTSSHWGAVRRAHRRGVRNRRVEFGRAGFRIEVRRARLGRRAQGYGLVVGACRMRAPGTRGPCVANHGSHRRRRRHQRLVHSEVLRPASLAAFSDDSRTGTCAAAVLREAGTCAAATAVNWDGEPESSFRSFPVCAPSATGEGLFMNV